MSQPAFTPKDPEFHARVAESFSRQRVMQTLGITITRLVAGEIQDGAIHVTINPWN